jgi:hypothetical protein
MAVVSFVLVAAAVIVARTTQANLIDRVDQQLASVGPFTPGAVGGPTQFYGAQIEDGSLTGVVQPNVNAGSVGTPMLPSLSDVMHDARTRQPFTVESTGGSGRFRMLATRRPDGSVNVVGLSLQDVDATTNRLRIVLGVAVGMVVAILGLVVFWCCGSGSVRSLMTRTAGDIAAGDQSQRARGPTGHGGGRWATLNSMMGTIEARSGRRR